MIKPGDWSGFQRQPVSAIWLVLIKSFGKVVKAVLPLALVMLFGTRKESNSPVEYLLIVVPFLILLSSAVDYYYFKFSVADNQLLVSKGLLSKKNIVLPLNKIQSVHIEQNWLHRLLDLAQLSFDSPGAAEAEVKINIEKDKAVALKAYILGNTDQERDAAMEENKEIARLSFADLAKLGISANHLETLAIMLGLVLSFFNNIRDIFEDRFSELYEESAAGIMNGGATFLIYIGIGILTLSILVSFIRIVLQYANFQISRTAVGFSVSGGLINTREQVIPFKKIQYLSWRTSWLRRQLPIYLMEYHSIGSPVDNKKLKVRIPVTSTQLLKKLVDIYHPLENEASAPRFKISRAYAYRTTLIWGILPFILFGGVGAFFFQFKASLLLILPVYVFLSAWLFYKKFRFSYTSSVIHLRQGIFGESDTVVKWQNIQSVCILQSLYQRRRQLATLKIFTAGGTLTVPFITLVQAEELQDYALYRIESADAPWM